MLSQVPSIGRGWGHELAGTASFGTIRWPKLHGRCLSRDTERCFLLMNLNLNFASGALLLDGLWVETGSVRAGNHPTAVLKWNHNWPKWPSDGPNYKCRKTGSN